MKKKYYVFVPRFHHGKIFEIWCNPATKAARRKAYNFTSKEYSLLETSYLYDGDTGELLGVFTADGDTRWCAWDKTWNKPMRVRWEELSTLAKAIKEAEG